MYSKSASVPGRVRLWDRDRETIRGGWDGRSGDGDGVRWSLLVPIPKIELMDTGLWLGLPLLITQRWNMGCGINPPPTLDAVNKGIHTLGRSYRHSPTFDSQQKSEKEKEVYTIMIDHDWRWGDELSTPRWGTIPFPNVDREKAPRRKWTDKGKRDIRINDQDLPL